MSEYEFTDETATVVILASIVRDMKHVLEWLTVALAAATITLAVYVIRDIARHDWIWLGFDALFCAALANAAIGSARRGRKYGSRRAANPAPNGDPA